MNLHTSCDLDWTYWPWDRQKCHLVVGSWTKTGWELDVQNLGGANRTYVDMSNYAPSAWSLVSGTQQRRVYNDYAGTQDYYIDIDVSLILDRRSILDKKVAVLPLLCAASLLLATFWTHPADTARLKLNSSVCIILVITLLSLRYIYYTKIHPMIIIHQVHAAISRRLTPSGDHLQHRTCGLGSSTTDIGTVSI